MGVATGQFFVEPVILTINYATKVLGYKATSASSRWVSLALRWFFFFFLTILYLSQEQPGLGRTKRLVSTETRLSMSTTPKENRGLA